jgi:cation diffusion facilitator family transporter
MQNHETRRQVRRVILLTLALNLAVATGKILVGLASGALSIVADGFHSLTDSLSSMIGLVANFIAARPPDADHPYGHRRFETLAALLVGGFLLLAAWEITRGALERLQHSGTLALTPLTFAILIATLFVNVFVSTYQRRQGERLRSEFLLADSAHTRSDVFVTSSVLASITLIALTGWEWIDIVAAFAVVILIARVAWRIVRQTGGILVDTAPYSEETLQTIIADLPSVTHVVRARSRGPADAAHIDIDVQVAPETTAEHTAAITDSIRQHLETHLDGVSEVEVHYMPDDSKEWDYALAARAAADALGLATHEVRVLDTPDKKVLEMHVEVSPGQTLTEAHHLVSRLEHDIRRRQPEITEVVTHIEPAQIDERGQRIQTAHGEQISQRVLALLQAQYPRVHWHDIRLYQQDTGLTLTLHASFSADVTVEFAHDVAETAETLLRAKLPQLTRITIHTEPHDHS